MLWVALVAEDTEGHLSGMAEALVGQHPPSQPYMSFMPRVKSNSLQAGGISSGGLLLLLLGS